MDGFLDKYKWENNKPKINILKGNTKKLIPKLAKDLDAGLVVMGTVCRTGIPGLIVDDCRRAGVFQNFEGVGVNLDIACHIGHLQGHVIRAGQKKIENRAGQGPIRGIGGVVYSCNHICPI